MKENTNPTISRSSESGLSSSPLFAPIAAAVVSWAMISLGFFGLKMLMEQRPEFVGQPMAFSKAVLIQEAPRIVSRKLTEDVSVIRTIQPQASDIHVQMHGRRDYRGLKTISDMYGQFSARYTLTNAEDEPAFVLFKCPHPRAVDNDNESSPAGGLKLQSSIPGLQENTTNAWLWSGAIPAHSAATLDISYQASSLKELAYRISPQNGLLLNQVRVTFDRNDLNSLHFESGDGTIADTTPVVWKRENFPGPDFFSASIVESRNLFTSLSQLVEIGPLISLLFFMTVTAMMWARQGLTALQVFTIAAGYALYFPLVVYLSSRFSFALALTLAFVVPGALLLNYARWLLGGGPAFLAAAVLLGLFQVFPTLAAFGGWNRGMVLLCLGIITLWVLINLQNKALRRRVIAAAPAAACFALLALPSTLLCAEIQVIMPAELKAQLITQKVESVSAVVGFDPARYSIKHEPTHLDVEGTIKFRALKPGDTPTALFTGAVHLQECRIDSNESNLAQIVSTTNGPALFVQHAGSGTIEVKLRVPVENKDGRKRAQIPLIAGSSTEVSLASPRPDLEFVSGALWNRRTTESGTAYEAGATGQGPMIVEWSEQPPASVLTNWSLAGVSTNTAAEAGGSYGIGLTRAQNLTIINSDGSCTHFTECELPAFQKDEFSLRLPANARLISASINGAEVNAPLVEDRICRIRLPERVPAQTGYRISIRLTYPPVRLGFFGAIELSLPEVFQTAGTLEWVVALPDGFETQVISSGLEAQRTAPDLAAFGDYGRVLKARQHTYLAKTLAPPAPVILNLKYRQLVAGLTDAQHERRE
jgi:hypothetical protein